MAGEAPPEMAGICCGKLRGLRLQPGQVGGIHPPRTLGHHHGGDRAASEEVGEPFLHLSGLGTAGKVGGLIVDRDLADPAEIGPAESGDPDPYESQYEPDQGPDPAR